MSGICGIVSLDGTPIEVGTLERMAGAAAGGGVVTIVLAKDGTAGFASSGSARVAAAGAGLEPGGATLVAADARLDNRQELAAALGLPVGSATDERLLAAAFERWGEQWHGHLRGGYAAALYDQQAGKLVLLRDRSGERGLYWSATPGGSGFLFGCESAQLVASGRLSGAPHRLRMLSYLLGAAADPTWSYFEGVNRVPEGHQVRLTRKRSASDCYWDWTSVAPAPWNASGAAPELARRLQEAVDRRLATQGENGILLSGGLDSASIAALAGDTLQKQDRRLWAFTWTSRCGDGIDETARSRALIASRPNVSEQAVQADELWPLSRYPEAYADRSDPETNAYPDLLLATLELARQRGVAVLMNGIGGDPVAGGLAPELSLLLQGRLGPLYERWRQVGLRRAGLIQELRAPSRRPRWPEWLTPGARREAEEAGLGRAPISWRTFSSRDRFRRAFLASPANATSLERFERLGRRLSIRIEAPWHDADLATLVLALRDRALDPAPPGKRLVRAAMAGRLPAAILQGGKGDGGSSLRARGLLGGAAKTIEKLLSSSRLAELGLVVGSRLLACYQESASRRQITPRLWEVLTAEAWLLANAGA